MATKKKKLANLNAKMKSHVTVPLSRTNATRCMEEVKKLSGEVEVLYSSIQSEETDDAKKAEHEKEFDDTEAITNEAKFGFSDILDALPPDTASTSSSSGSSKGSKPKLPEIKVPNFSGNPSEWITFRDLYTNAVHNSTSADSTKMTYLKSLLYGNAAKLVQSMPISDANYSVAWDTVTKRYENRRQLFMNIANTFSSHQGVTADPESLSSLVYATDQFSMAVDAMGIAEKWDAILMYLTYQKLDQASKQLWEMSMSDTEIPASKTLLEFMVQRAGALSVSMPTHKQVQGNAHAHHQHMPRAHYTTPHESGQPRTCPVCEESHPIWHCNAFKSMSVGERRNKVHSSRLCYVCLSPGHREHSCASTSTCSKCHQRHNSLLHTSKVVSFNTDSSHSSTEPSSGSDPNQIESYHSYYREDRAASHAMLATAMIRVQDVDGNPQLVRAFMDGGTTASFITEKCVNRLGLGRYSTSKSVTGMGGSTVGKTKGMTTLRFIPHFKTDFSEPFCIEAHIVKKVTNNLPHTKLHSTSWSHLKNLKLADPTFDTPGHIDIMLGADIFYELLLSGKRTGGRNSLVGTNSQLGWLIAGVIGTQEQESLHSFSTRIEYTAKDPKPSRERNRQFPSNTFTGVVFPGVKTKQANTGSWTQRNGPDYNSFATPGPDLHDKMQVFALYRPPHRRHQFQAVPKSAEGKIDRRFDD